MKKVLLWILIIIMILLLLLGGAYIWQRHRWEATHVTVGGVEYPIDLEELDLSGQSITYLKELPNLPNLKKLDLRNTGLSIEECLWLRETMPECEILWLVPFQGNYLAEDTEQITVSSLTQEDMAVLSLLTELETVDGRACEDPAPLLELKSRYPELNVFYSLEVEQQRYDWDTRELTLTGQNLAHFQDTFPLLPLLESVTLTEPVEDTLMMTTLLDTFPHISFDYCLTLYGQTISLDVETLDFTGMSLESTEPLHAAMPHLKSLTHVEMVDCGIPDEEMGRLNQTWENTLFTWEIAIGHFKIRNDAVYFMPWQYSRYKLTDDDADKLQYLTELICLDFGHNYLTRTDYLAYMPKLQFLLLGDTRVTEISAAANLKELKYAELFMTDITDFSPLLGCPNLVDLNVSFTFPDDPMIFGQMTQLENLWLCGNDTKPIGKELQKLLPNTTIMCTSASSTGDGWRDLPNYFEQRDIMGMWYMTG